jgi:hypothetical protein
MTTDLKKIWAIFTPAERRKSAWMLVLALAETSSAQNPIVPF